MADERETLLGGIDDDSNPTKKALRDGDAKTVPVQDLARARNMFFWWTFIGYICWGINAELYSNLFYDVIDKGDYSSASMYSTVALSMYSVASFFSSPVVATLSDRVGRKPIFVIAAAADGVSGILMGLVPNNWVFICFYMLQGVGDNSQATGYSLLADYVVGTPVGHSGSEADSWFMQKFYAAVRLGSSSSAGEGGGSDSKGGDDGHYVSKELNVQFTVVLILQSLGMVLGVVLGDGIYLLLGSYEWAFAFSGFGCLPMIPLLYWYMPETVPPPRRRRLTLPMVGQACRDQLGSLFMFAGNRRLWGLAAVSFLMQFVSVGMYDVVLYWGEWKFGWGTNLEAAAMLAVMVSAVVGAVAAPRAFDACGQGHRFSLMIGLLGLISAAFSIGCGLGESSAVAITCIFFFGIGFGTQPIINSQIGAEVPAEDQGRIQGFNYAVNTVAWATGPYAYWYMFAAYVDDDALTDDDGGGDDDSTHVRDYKASLYWWVSCAILTTASLLVLLVVGDSKAAKLFKGAAAPTPASAIAA